ncbi:Spermidine N(1)-acetyltransferase [Acaryochloris thomasi RCC1774]|uniref:Spermidine N(1)-acetyltransferase n=1 Tax=Acaryochloris thomasi RCC1774 TaxID=1764569 RepID=A0A2W1JHK0_9CYAN|nr:GNAT family protein [Acaryochloris thomasi]PZD73043.1 Spermidine N(1)-acetyltransferase [Acaryochloris thomasi RCC1774]
MSPKHSNIPDITLEALCRTFFKEVTTYGFQQLDYIRFVNLLLDLAMQNDRGSASVSHTPSTANLDFPVSSGLPIEGPRVDLRAFNPATDLDLLEGWLNDDDGRYFLLSRTTSPDLDIEDVINQKSNLVGTISLKDGQAIGSVIFLDYDAMRHKAELRKLIGIKSMRGMGYAREATELWLSYGLNSLGLKKIYLNTLDTNLRNLRLNEQLGFKIEGILRNEVYFDERYHDVLRMGLWRE